jgi:hypothetical protein
MVIIIVLIQKLENKFFKINYKCKAYLSFKYVFLEYFLCFTENYEFESQFKS